MAHRSSGGRFSVAPAVACLVAGALLVAGHRPPAVLAADGSPAASTSAHGTLVKYEPLAEPCMMPAEEQRVARRLAARAARNSATTAADRAVSPAFLEAMRQIKDPYPSFAAVSVDPVRDEVVFTDESLFQVLVYDRREDTPDGVDASRPKRTIVGEKTNIEFQSGVWVDPKTGEIYAVNNDTRDTTVVFPPNANGDVEPTRGIRTPHGSFGIAVDEAHEELFVTVQHDASVVTYWKGSGGRMSPIRMIQGTNTKLADPHGIAYDPKEDVLYVANFGSRHDVSSNLTPRTGVPSEGNEKGKENWPLGREWGVPGSGIIGGPSVSVYRRTARGDEPPLRVIQGPATQFDWPTGLAFNPDTRELYVANDMGPSVLVFDGSATGNAAPKRVLEGSRTGLANPTSVALDTTHGELWVANFGGHTGTVYPIDAKGNVAPLRTIRNAPPGSPSLMIGNPGAVAYDTTREQILVPN